jgi:hypothetical protein
LDIAASTLTLNNPRGGGIHFGPKLGLIGLSFGTGVDNLKSARNLSTKECIESERWKISWIAFRLACHIAHSVTTTLVSSSCGSARNTAASQPLACGSCTLAMNSVISSEAKVHTHLAILHSRSECFHVGMKTERKRTELTAAIFVFRFFYESGNKYGNSGNKYETRYCRKHIQTEYGTDTDEKRMITEN